MSINIDGKAVSTKESFKMDCGVGINIRAGTDKIWPLLVNATNYPSWNSTVISIDGQIELGKTIKLKSTSDPKRTFSLKVTEMVPQSKMVWSDGNFIFRGVRTYTLNPKSDGSTDFTMHEVFTGLMLPLISKSLPDFRPFFQKFAEDLKRAAENA